MFAIFPIVMIAVLLIGLFFCVYLPADFRKSFFNPETLGERLLLKSLGVVAIAALIAEVVVGHGPDNGLNGISPCNFFGAYIVLVVYGRAGWFMWTRHSQKQAAQ